MFCGACSLLLVLPEPLVVENIVFVVYVTWCYIELLDSVCKAHIQLLEVQVGCCGQYSCELIARVPGVHCTACFSVLALSVTPCWQLNTA